MKKRISIFLIYCIVLMNLSTCVVYAQDPVEQSIIKITDGIANGYDRLLQYAGMIIDTGIKVQRSNLQFIKDRLVALGFLNQDATEEDVQDWFDDNIIQSGDNVEYTQDLNIYIKNEMSSIQSECGYRYVYPWNVRLNPSEWQSGDNYSALVSFLQEQEQENFCSYYYNQNIVVTISCNDFGLVNQEAFQGTPNTFFVKPFSYSSWQEVAPTEVKFYRYNATDKEYQEESFVGYTNWQKPRICDGILQNPPFSQLGQYGFVLISEKNLTYKMYMTLADLQDATQGQSRYYVNDSYNKFNTTTGSYNTTTTDNSINYGDVTNYINNYYGQNGEYPTPAQINVYITNNIPETGTTPTPTPNPDNPGGGGSGSDDDNGSIFDWLSKIGSLIGNLISGVGGFVAGILEGVVNALTSILDTITSIITTITSSIPDNFNNLMTTILGWLPEEWTAVISAFLLVSLLVGLFKLFRG